VLLFHHDESSGELLLVVTRQPGPAGSAAAAPPGTASAAGAAPPNAPPAAPVSFGKGAPPGASPRAAAVPAAAAELAGCTQQSVAVASMRASAEEVAALVGAFRAYRRQLGRKLLDATTAARQRAAHTAAAAAAEAAARGGAPSATATQPVAAAGPGARAQQEGKQGGADKKAAAVAAAAVAIAAAEAACLPEAPVLGPEANLEWQLLLDRFEAFLSPLGPALQAALPELRTQQLAQTVLTGPLQRAAPGRTASAVPAPAAAPAAHSGSGDDLNGWPAGGHSVLLLLDGGLADLPWEALPALRATCASVARCFSAALTRHLLFPPAAAACGAAGPLPAAPASPATQRPASTAGASKGASGAGLAVPKESHQAAAPVPVVDLARLTYIVDPLHEESDAAQPPGAWVR
jgi:hypothetical protein